ncbi:hypothetical protein QU38_01410, partial [Staphylococcus aureus]
MGREIVDLERAATGGHDPFHNGQPQAGAVGSIGSLSSIALGLVGQDLDGKAGAVVGHDHA